MEKKSVYYLITGALLLFLFAGGVTFAYFSSGIVVDSKNISVITDTSRSFSSNILKDLSLHVDTVNMSNENIGWSKSDNATVTINLDGLVGSYCTYDLVYENTGDYYKFNDWYCDENEYDCSLNENWVNDLMMDVILNADTDEGSEAYKTTTINTMGRK